MAAPIHLFDRYFNISGSGFYLTLAAITIHGYFDLACRRGRIEAFAR